MPNRIAKLEKYLDNKLPAAIDEAGLFAGSAGESPSRYSRSPGMWNAACSAEALRDTWRT